MLHNLHVAAGCRVMVHSSDVPESGCDVWPPAAQSTAQQVDLAPLQARLLDLDSQPRDLLEAPAVEQLYAMLGRPAPANFAQDDQEIVKAVASTAGRCTVQASLPDGLKA